MICIIALVVFAILALFSATYRPLAVEAFDCVFRRLTLRKCHTGLDKRLKKKILGGVMKRTPRVGIFLYKYLEIFSWIFILITIWALVLLGISGYNYYIYGNCNGEQSDAFCIFNPTGSNSHVSEVEDSCAVDGMNVEKPEMTIQHLDISQFPSRGSGQRLILFGCYACSYTRELMPTINEILSENHLEYVFVHFSTKAGTEYLHAYEYCMQEQDINEYWRFHEALFTMNSEDTQDEQKVKDLVSSLNVDTEEMNACIVSENTQNHLNAMHQQLEQTHIYGTPTVYINGEFIVGPKPKRVYERLLK